MSSILLLSFSILIAGCGSASNRVLESDSWKTNFSKTYNHQLNVSYGKTEFKECKLDVYFIKKSHPVPVLLYFHGGAWVKGSKDEMTFASYMKSGWGIVNVEYRFANKHPMPACVEDCRAALAWVYAHAQEYNFDTSKILTGGSSAGGHLALITGLLPAHSEFDSNCVYQGELRVAAIINNYGPVDLNKLLSNPKVRKTSDRWFGDNTNFDDLARRISPITYIRSGSPPVFTVHGDADPTVPYDQAVLLRNALEKAGVPNELFTVKGGGHGKFIEADKKEIMRKMSRFLKKQVGVNLSGKDE